MSAHAHDTVSATTAVTFDPEALEAAPKAWYDDLKIGQVVVAAFVSTVLSLATIFLAQGLYFHWKLDEITSKDKRPTVSQATTIVQGQQEMLRKGRPVTTLTERQESGLYYQGIEQAELIPIEEAKQAVLEAYGNRE